MNPLVATCPRCGAVLPAGARYCSSCGVAVVPAAMPFAPQPSPRIVTTHTVGFTVIAFLISFLWFRINGVPLLPVGLLGGLVVAWWSQDIDRQFGKPSQFALAVALSVVGAFIGFLL